MDLTRRGFFGLLAALPFMKRFVPLRYCAPPNPISYAELERAYHTACASGSPPNLLGIPEWENGATQRPDYLGIPRS